MIKLNLHWAYIFESKPLYMPALCVYQEFPLQAKLQMMLLVVE